MSAKTLISIAKSKVTANRLAKALSTSDLENAIKNLQGALTKAKKQAADKAAKKQAADLKKLKAMMAKMGISAADVQKLAGVKAKRKAVGKKVAKRKTGPRKGKKVAPKYQLKVGKEAHQWTGRGRMPLVFKEFAEKNGSLDKCLIK